MKTNENFISRMEYVIVSTSLYITHSFIKRFNLDSSTEYFILHIVSNLGISLYSYNDLNQIMEYPMNTDCIPNPKPSIITLCLHFYHVLFFKLQRIEFLHHGLMMGILLYPVFYNQHLCLANVILFFTSGLPGLIIYCSLVMLKLGVINRLRQIQVDKKINIYLRSPGILFCIIIMGIRSYSEKWVVFLIQGILYWNAQYFLELACNRV